MLPDHYPVFHVDLDYQFESSDNVFPTFKKQSCEPVASNKASVLKRFKNTTVFSTIGQRKDNLDKFVVLEDQKYTILSLFDGHCDQQPVNYLKNQLTTRIAKNLKLISNPEKAILQAFRAIQRQVVQKFEKGSTALVVLVLNEELIVANLGDSKLIGMDENGKMKDYTSLHNLTNSEQLKKVINAGGIVLKKGDQYRINGELNLSRCFGDRQLKYCLSSQPDIYRFPVGMCKKWILSTDGFYNAERLELRLQKDYQQLLHHDNNLYKDNATAIFFQP